MCFRQKPFIIYKTNVQVALHRKTFITCSKRVFCINTFIGYHCQFLNNTNFELLIFFLSTYKLLVIFFPFDSIQMWFKANRNDLALQVPIGYSVDIKVFKICKSSSKIFIHHIRFYPVFKTMFTFVNLVGRKHYIMTVYLFTMI